MSIFKKITLVTAALTIMLSSAAAVIPIIDTNEAHAAQALELNKYVISLGKNERIKLNANQNVSWRTSDRKILTVDKDGFVSGISCGKAYITARTNNGVEKSCCITVKKAPDSVSMSSSSIVLGVGESMSVSSIVPEGTASASRRFYSADPSVVRMTKTQWRGEFSAVKPGSTVVYVRLYNGKTAKCNITVRNAPKKVTITKGILKLGVGEKYSFGSDLDNGAACFRRTYRTSNSAVVKMTRTDWQGDIVAVSPGVAYVTVRTYNGKESACKVTVCKAPDKIYLTRSSLTMTEGESYTLGSFTNSGAGALRKAYRSSNSSVLKITSAQKGSFTALKPGTAYITVRTYNGKEASCKVTVEPKKKIQVINGVTYINGTLIANKTYSLPKSYGNGLDPTAYSAFQKMAADAARDGISLYIVSGFRSYETQYYTYNYYCSTRGQAAADRFSARPGHSEHQTGLAMDINDASDWFTGTPEQKWLAKNCYKYGFVIRYPEGKEHITGYKYESWHIRYLGKELAQELTKKGLTVEEYFDITSKYE